MKYFLLSLQPAHGEKEICLVQSEALTEDDITRGLIGRRGAPKVASFSVCTKSGVPGRILVNTAHYRTITVNEVAKDEIVFGAPK